MTRTVENSTDNKPPLNDYFHLPLREAAKIYNLSAHMFRKYCRSQGLFRWPYKFKPIHIRKFDPVKFFDLPEKDVAAIYQVSIITFRNHCRRIGINNWPSQKNAMPRSSYMALEFLKSDQFDPCDYLNLSFSKAAELLNVSLPTLKKYCLSHKVDPKIWNLHKQIEFNIGCQFDFYQYRYLSVEEASDLLCTPTTMLQQYCRLRGCNDWCSNENIILKPTEPNELDALFNDDEDILSDINNTS